MYEEIGDLVSKKNSTLTPKTTLKTFRYTKPYFGYTLRAGYFWPTLEQDCKMFFQKCKCC